MKVNGYTLLEVLVVMTIVAILAGLAVPGFDYIVNRTRVKADWNTLHTDLNFARSAAIGRGSKIVFCPSDDGAACGGSWSDGWLMFDDTDGDDSLDAGEEIVRVHEAYDPNTVTLKKANGNALGLLSFNSRGYASESSTFTLCDKSAEAARARAVLILNSGRVLRSRADSDTGLHHDINNEVLSCGG